MQKFRKSRKHCKSSYEPGPAPWASCLLMCSFPGAVSLCEHCFKMMLENGLLFEYEADTDWHYGLTRTLHLDRIEDRQAVINDVLEIVELLK